MIISEKWKSILEDEFNEEYMRSLESFLCEEENKGKVIYPSKDDRFNALNETPFDSVKVVILGQDPYFGGQAHGLSFSVKPGVKTPPSLVNIYKELKDDLNIPTPNHGHLTQWSHQGVLLLNSVLTVEAQKAGSHQNRGWEIFTDKIIKAISDQKESVVFILWGGYAKRKGKQIDKSKHLVIESPHPSPLSSFRGFFGSKPFSKTNDYLKIVGKSQIQWAIDDI